MKLCTFKYIIKTNQKQNLSRLARQCVFIDGSSTAPPCGMPAAYLKEPLRLRDFLQAGVCYLATP